MKTLSALLLLCAVASAQDTLNVAVINENVSPPLYSWIDLLEDEGCEQDVTKVSGSSEGNYFNNNWPTIVSNNPDVVLIAFGKGPGTLANLEDRLEVMIEDARDRGMFPVLVTPKPVLTVYSGTTDFVQDDKDDESDVIKDVGTAMNVPVIDLNSWVRNVILGGCVSGCNFDAKAPVGTVDYYFEGAAGSMANYVASLLEIKLASSYQSADFDYDGDVDGADFLIWQANFGSGTMHCEGDADRDGDVDGADFLIWQTQFE